MSKKINKFARKPSHGEIPESPSWPHTATSFWGEAFIALIYLYRYCISPLNPPCCRYFPTCSEYAIESFGRYNLAKALFLTIKRIASCNPWGGSGFDPVPEKPQKPLIKK